MYQEDGLGSGILSDSGGSLDNELDSRREVLRIGPLANVGSPSE